MSDWSPLVIILTVIVVAVVLALVVSINIKNKGYAPPDDFSDTMPMDHIGHRAIAQNPPVEAAPVHTELPAAEPAPVNPALAVAQDNLNYTLWHQMVWLIPNAQWIHTQHQSLAEVQWLCLGPDHYYFIAHAQLAGNEWKWTFTKA